MLSHLKKWILDGVGKRPTRRRSELPHFRGQIEQLESRTVLSATIGMVAVDVVAVDFEANTVTVVAVWESRPPAPEWLALGAPNQAGDAPWETLPSHRYINDPWRPFVLDARNDLRPPVALLGSGQVYGSGPDGGTT